MKRFAMLTALLAFAAMPAIAEAKNVRHRGELVDTKDSKVTMKLAKRKGEIKQVREFEADGVPTTCEGGDAVFTLTALDPIPVNKRGRFKERLTSDEGDVLRVKGTVKRSGRKVVGAISSSDFDGGRKLGSCRIPKQRYKTSKV